MHFSEKKVHFSLQTDKFLQFDVVILQPNSEMNICLTFK